ncbi:MAG TPA: PQQ-dependent sugar dehydrogenase [Pseudoxanthomonas sp.]
MSPSPYLLACCLLLLTACDLPGTVDENERSTQKTPERPAPRLVASPRVMSVNRPAAVQAGAVAQAAGQPPSMGGNLPARQIPNPAFKSTEVARFDQPWAMTFLPDGRLLVTEKPGRLRLIDVATRQIGEIIGVPAVAYGGQGGLGDVVLHPQFASNRLIYLSYAESGTGGRGAAVARATLNLDASGNNGSLSNLQVLWRQIKVGGEGHYSHRLAFDRNGKLFISSGERQQGSPAQDMQSNLGKIIRINDDGSIPADNPFASQGGIAAQIWTLGHRNVYGLVFNAQGQLWEHEMGPAGGDELNLIERGSNYGWPIVSNGSNYDGSDIPDHSTRPEFNAPEAWWTPVIAPAGFIIYDGNLFPYFRGNGFIGGLASTALIRIQFDGNTGREVSRYPMGQRIREVEQGPDGAIWLLEDGSNVRLLKLTPT